MCVDAEHRARDNRRLTRLLKGAELRIASACVEDVEMSSARGLDKALLRQATTPPVTPARREPQESFAR